MAMNDKQHKVIVEMEREIADLVSASENVMSSATPYHAWLEGRRLEMRINKLRHDTYARVGL